MSRERGGGRFEKWRNPFADTSEGDDGTRGEMETGVSHEGRKGVRGPTHREGDAGESWASGIKTHDSVDSFLAGMLLPLRLEGREGGYRKRAVSDPSEPRRTF